MPESKQKSNAANQKTSKTSTNQSINNNQQQSQLTQNNEGDKSLANETVNQSKLENIEADFIENNQISIQIHQKEQLKIFISSINGIVGHALVEFLRNDHFNDINPHIIYGTRDKNEPDNELPRGATCFVDIEDNYVYLAKLLLESDVVIYQIDNNPLDEIKFAHSALQLSEIQDQKIFILISSPMVWSRMAGQKQRTSSSDETTQNINPLSNMQVITERDFKQRKGFPKYEVYKQLENLILNPLDINENLKSYVLCPGILYGNGELQFYKYFRTAFMGEDSSYICQYGNGDNIIPMIHVNDLASFVQKIIQCIPVEQYLIAVDCAEISTQKAILRAISETIGTGQINYKTIIQGALDTDFEILRLNVKMKNSEQCFAQSISIGDQPPQQLKLMIEEDEQLNAGQIQQQQIIDWHCQDGFVKNIRKISEEFMLYRGLKTNKIVICGPPAVGKSQICQKLAQELQLPYIGIQDIIQYGYDSLTGPLAQEFKDHMESVREKQLEEAQINFEAAQKKKKLKKGEVPEEFDPNSVVIRVPDEYLRKIYQDRLNQNDCLFKGYILDGYLKCYNDAYSLFMKKEVIKIKIEKGEAKEEDQFDSSMEREQTQQSKKSIEAQEEEQFLEEEVERLIPEIVPGTFFFIDASDQFLIQRVQSLPEEVQTTTHFNAEGQSRRLPIFRKNNMDSNDSQASTHLKYFFYQHQDVIKYYTFNVGQDDVNSQNIYELVKRKIEEQGKNKQYISLNEEIEIQKREYFEQIEIREEKYIKQEEERQNLIEEEKLKKILEEEEKQKLQLIMQKEIEVLDERSQSIRQYLCDIVVPFVTEALIEICKKRPIDPVEKLARYLIQRADEVDFYEVRKDSD